MLDEQHRHQCEVRQVLRWRQESKEKAMAFIEKVKAARGEAVAAKLQSDCSAQWAKGNRGDKGDWR